MNRIATLVGSLRKAYPEIESCKFELIFSFPTEEAAKEYFRKTYHWEHHDGMIKYQLNGECFSGFKTEIELNANYIKHLTGCYVDLASETQGSLHRWKLWI
ncbi:hypothetical protein [Pseudoalteromonas ruthenica]|uniref:Uncharacterized protein n=1 Tax=Pseudoalteromonas ruthenica TaxID=151081 RepID=A0A0F4PP95_9GAMM|nr:hypothetical protein [Pseudoalteromonas ruthenica]KJY96051.1 hypothetical protein TW76_12790 [Pseudoalteromonas ruthenica]KJY96798.1 hypothetical protein TW72_16420 [Pseudoalteromonas ruthenica]TMO91460.1 hypothetical protein CWC13_15150 [Pseudoalteromonas ruthenica]TMP01559.1 hypothetical protein CWC07_01025 [Pseudoalteromonas ruthenica]TMP03862.1 hypothetical protein CWC09_17175 [Pseudoalteromonas ruthenica]|tara:strand:+ start:685 stop:987 length:303 start_codon:yes stop_codon:yes gene_type:complete